MAEPEEAARAFIPPTNNGQLDRSRSYQSAAVAEASVDADADGRSRYRSSASNNVDGSSMALRTGGRDTSRSTTASETPTLAEDDANARSKDKDVPVVQAAVTGHESGGARRQGRARVDEEHDAEADDGDEWQPGASETKDEKDLYGDAAEDATRARVDTGDVSPKEGKKRGKGLTEGDAGELALSAAFLEEGDSDSGSDRAGPRACAVDVCTVTWNDVQRDGKAAKWLGGADSAEMAEIPVNKMWLVMPSVGLVLFLAALDQTIVATALPTIAEELHLSPAEYQWVGTAYMLAVTLQGPMNGRVSDIVGRKPMLYTAILIFTIASALCGAAKSSTWLIVARAFQGLGAGAIMGLTSIVVSDITPLSVRPMYQGYLGVAWSVASVLGPILGGLLTQKASWRWCFYINLPTCGVAFVLLLLTLNLNKTRLSTFAHFRKTFDFLGLLLAMAGSALVVVGFATAADSGFDDKAAIGCIAAGAGVLVLTIVNCVLTKRNAIIPARLFRNRTTLLFMIGSIFQATAFLPANFLLPQLFQGVSGADALHSGLMLLPFAVSVSACTVVAGQINTRFKIIRPVAWTGYGLGGLGYALFYATFKYPIPLATQEGLQIITGVGIGFSIVVPLIILQNAMPLKDMAAVTGSWSMSRNIGGAIGLAVFTAILNTEIRSQFQEIPGFGTEFNVPESVEGYAELHRLPEGQTKEAVLGAFADALRTCWIVAAALMLAALVITLPTRSYSTDRSPGGKRTPASDRSAEEGPGGDAGAQTGADRPEMAKRTGSGLVMDA